MAISESIVVDSNYFISLFNPNDSCHTQARLIANDLERKRHNIVISNFNFLEIVTVLSQRKGRHAGREAGVYLLSAPSIEIIHIDSELQQETWDIFHSVQLKDVSFVDCSIIATMKAEGITTLLTFDNHFKKLQKHHRFSLYP